MERVRSLVQQPAGYKSYNSRSGEIFGILSQMKEGIEVARERKNTKVMELSEAEIAVVNAKHALKDARETLSADQKFLVDLMEKCAVTEKEYAKRKSSRQEEIVAIGEALGILTGDEARDLFTSTLGFTQVAKTSNKADAFSSQSAAAKKSGSAQIA